MKKLNFLLATFALFCTGSSLVLAAVTGSPHDLTNATGTAFSTTGNTEEVCVFCHTPHGGNNNGAPLWNRTTSATVFTMYNNTFSSTIDMTVAGTPQGVSAACMSCHDGTIGFDVLINATTSASGTYNYNAAGADQAWTFSGDDSMVNQAAPVLFTSSLTNQHPISITYDNAADTAFLATPTAPVKLYNGQVECASCHDPHENAIVPFLRTSNAASALCNSCHIK
jgi:predicted CXXCH cytochrome family protein